MHPPPCPPTLTPLSLTKGEGLGDGVRRLLLLGPLSTGLFGFPLVPALCPGFPSAFPRQAKRLPTTEQFLPSLMRARSA